MIERLVRWLMRVKIGESLDFLMLEIPVLRMLSCKFSRILHHPLSEVFVDPCRQTEVLGEYFVRRYEYIPPPITAPLLSADFTSRSSRSKTRRSEVTQEDPPAPASKYLHVHQQLLIADLYVLPFHAYSVHYIRLYHHPFIEEESYTINPKSINQIVNTPSPHANSYPLSTASIPRSVRDKVKKTLWNSSQK